MFRKRLCVVLSIGIILSVTPLINDYGVLKHSETFRVSQTSEDIEFVILTNGFSAQGVMTWPGEITQRIIVLITSANNISTVFADITDNQENRSYRVNGSLVSGNLTDGRWEIVTSRFMSWEGGVYTIYYMVWVGDVLDHWSSAWGFQGRTMYPSSLPPFLIAGSIGFLLIAIIVTVVNLHRRKRSK